jgi:esterase/lipase superfamily enzyme
LVLIGTTFAQIDFEDYYDSDIVISEVESPDDFMPGIIGELDISVIQ